MSIRISQFDEPIHDLTDNEVEILEVVEGLSDQSLEVVGIMLGLGMKAQNRVYDYLKIFFENGEELDDNIIQLIEDLKDADNQVLEEEHIKADPKPETPSTYEALINIPINPEVKDIMNKKSISSRNYKKEIMRKAVWDLNPELATQPHQVQVIEVAVQSYDSLIQTQEAVIERAKELLANLPDTPDVAHIRESVSNNIAIGQEQLKKLRAAKEELRPEMNKDDIYYSDADMDEMEE